jgi:hypothetical protein
MSAAEFPEPSHAGVGQGGVDQSAVGQAVTPAATTLEIAHLRARTVVLRNSRFVCYLTMSMGVIAVILGICMVLEGGSLMFPVSAITFMAVLSGAQWILGGVMMCAMCPWAWKWGTRMLSVNVKLDAKGVDFNLGTKKKPDEFFMAWEQVAAVQQKRAGKVWQYIILGKNGDYATYSTYTFFRPTHVARMIAERAGLTVQKV